MDFMFDLQLFAATISGADAKRVADGASAYFISTDNSTGTWYKGDSDGVLTVGTGVADSASVWASYDGTNLIVNGGSTGNVTSVTISDSDSYTVKYAAAGTMQGVGTAKLLTAGAGTVNVYGVDVGLDGNGITIKNGAISAITGTATVDQKETNMALKVAGLTSAKGLVIGGKAVNVSIASGTFKYSDDVYIYEATDTSKGQGINLAAQDSAAWSVLGTSQGDSIVSGQKADTLYGGAGADTIAITASNTAGVNLFAGEGSDLVSIGASVQNATVDLGAGNDSVKATETGTLQNITIVSSEGKNTVNAGTVSTSLVSLGGGADSIVVTASLDNTVYGGAGDDTIKVYGNTKSNTVYGGDGADIFALSGTTAVAIEDYSFAQGDALLIDDAQAAAMNIIVQTDTNLAGGTVSVSADDKATIGAVSGNAYVALFKDGDKNSQYVGWVGADDAATIDASADATTNSKAVILTGRGNSDVGDLLTGGAKNDTIYAGTNDTVYGGAGNNKIVVGTVTGTNTNTKTAVTVGITGSSGKDTVVGFTGGFTAGESNALQIDGLTSASALKISYNGTNATVKGSTGSTSVVLGNVDSQTDTNYAALLVNSAKVAAIKAGSTISVTDDINPDYFFGDSSAVSYASITDALEVNLGDTEKFHGISTLTGGAGDSTLWGSSSKETIVAGSGATSMTSGAGADYMVAGSGEDTFFFLAGDGKDSIAGFGEYNESGTNMDLLNTYGNAITKAVRTSSNTVKITVGEGTSDVLTLMTASSSNNQNAMIQFTDGTNKGVAKIGYASTANSFSYNAAATAYLGGSAKDTISIASGNSDDLKIWLDGSQGAVYSSIDVIVDNGKGDNQLAGDAASQSIQAGSGNDSLWGGVGSAADTLKGGSGSDVFFYGYGQGKDVLQNVGADDLVNLYDIDLSKLTITGGEIGSSAISITTTAGETLTVNKASSAATTTFQLNDGSKWTANYSTKTWEQA